MSFLAWLITLLCFLSFGGAFILMIVAQYGAIAVVVYFGVSIIIPYKLIHKPVLELDDKVNKERREKALQKYLKVVKKQDVET